MTDHLGTFSQGWNFASSKVWAELNCGQSDFICIALQARLKSSPLRWSKLAITARQ